MWQVIVFCGLHLCRYTAHSIWFFIWFCSLWWHLCCYLLLYYLNCLMIPLILHCLMSLLYLMILVILSALWCPFFTLGWCLFLFRFFNMYVIQSKYVAIIVLNFMLAHDAFRNAVTRIVKIPSCSSLVILCVSI